MLYSFLFYRLPANLPTAVGRLFLFSNPQVAFSMVEFKTWNPMNRGRSLVLK